VFTFIEIFWWTNFGTFFEGFFFFGFDEEGETLCFFTDGTLGESSTKSSSTLNSFPLRLSWFSTSLSTPPTSTSCKCLLLISARICLGDEIPVVCSLACVDCGFFGGDFGVKTPKSKVGISANIAFDDFFLGSVGFFHDLGVEDKDGSEFKSWGIQLKVIKWRRKWW